jgi:hypothetical protein
VSITFGLQPPPCPPKASPIAPARRLAHRFCRPRPPPCAAFKRSAPPHELPFSSFAYCCHCAIVPPSLSHLETMPRSPSELPVTAPSSASTPGAPPTSLPVPSATPPLHHRLSSLAKPSHRGHPTPAILRPSRPHPKHRATEYILPDRSDPSVTPYSGLPPSLPCHRSPSPQRSLLVSNSPLFGRKTGPSPHRLAPRPLHRRTPPASRPDFTGNSPLPTGEKVSPVSSRAKRLRWVGPLRSGWTEQCRGT